MEFLKKLYPRRAKAQEKDTLVKAIIFYAIGIVAVMVVSFVIGFFPHVLRAAFTTRIQLGITHSSLVIFGLLISQT